MAKYNLINSGYIQSSTTSGTGNKDIEYSELKKLTDGNTTSSGITLSNTDVLYIDIDLTHRILVDELLLYIDTVLDRSTALSSVDFYYKNDALDDYVMCAKDNNTTTFYPTDLPDIFSPRYIRIIIDSIECTLYELKITNDDYEVSFGEAGTDTLVRLEGVNSEYTEVEIFNNSDVGTSSVNAYVTVDYTGEEPDFFIKLSDTSTGEYRGLTDDVLLGDHTHDSKYNWRLGTLENITINNNYLITQSDTINEGYYTTPIIAMDEAMHSTFVINKFNIPSGTNIGWNASSEQPTIKVRSSDTAPEPLISILMPFNLSDGHAAGFSQYNISTGEYEPIFFQTDLAYGTNYHFQGAMFSKVDNSIVVLAAARTGYYQWHYDFKKYDYFGADYKEIGSATYRILNDSADMGPYTVYKNLFDLDFEGNAWWFDSYSNYKLKFTDGVDFVTTTVSTSSDDFITDIAASKVDKTCWYLDTLMNTVVRVDHEGTLVFSSSMTKPSNICTLVDGGCWVADNGTRKFYRYSNQGELLSEVSYVGFESVSELQEVASGTVEEILWIIVDDNYIYKIDFTGKILAGLSRPGKTNYLRPFKEGCIAWDSQHSKIYHLDLNANIVKIFDRSSYSIGAPPFIIRGELGDELRLNRVCKSLVPHDKDPVWGTEAGGWNLYSTAGASLPFAQYHQLQYKLTSNFIGVPAPSVDFESGLITPWNWQDDSVSAASSTYAYRGTYSMGVKNSANNHHFYYDLDLSSVVGLDSSRLAAGEYRINTYFWSRSSRFSMYRYVEYTFMDSGDNILTKTASDYIMNHYWERGGFSAYVPATTTAIKIRLFNEADSNHAIYWDDISVSFSVDPEVKSVYIPKPIKLKDIPPKQYKKLYIKTEYPVDTDYKEFESGLKCWWAK